MYKFIKKNRKRDPDEWGYTPTDGDVIETDFGIYEIKRKQGKECCSLCALQDICRVRGSWSIFDGRECSSEIGSDKYLIALSK